jgi:hypothetical protein
MSVKSEFTLDKSVQEQLFQQIFQILDEARLGTELEILLHKTVLSFFGKRRKKTSHVVPYSKSLEVFDLCNRAYFICLLACQTPELSSAAARALNKIVRTIRTEEIPLEELMNGLRALLEGNMDIVEKLTILDGYIFLFASKSDKEDIPLIISTVLDPIVTVGVQHCDSVTALNISKVVFAIGKALYTTAPGKLGADSWTRGEGRAITDWVRMMVGVFVDRFGNDFEIMEVFGTSVMPNLDYNRDASIRDIQWRWFVGFLSR